MSLIFTGCSRIDALVDEIRKRLPSFPEAHIVGTPVRGHERNLPNANNVPMVQCDCYAYQSGAAINGIPRDDEYSENDSALPHTEIVPVDEAPAECEPTAPIVLFLEVAVVSRILSGSIFNAIFASGITETVALKGVSALGYAANQAALDFLTRSIPPGTTIWLEVTNIDNANDGELYRYVWHERPRDATIQRDMLTVNRQLIIDLS